MGSWEKELQEYIYYIRLEKKLSDNTVEAYIRDLKQMAEYLEHEFSIRPQQAEERHIEAFLAHLYDKGVKKTTQARILSGIKSFYYYLLINDRIENLPTEFIDPPKTGRKLPDVLSVAEIESIIHTFDSDTRFGIRNKAMVETLYSCGLRVSELITLRLSDLFFNDGFIRVIGKGDKQRLVPISETARHRIEEYLLQRQTMQTDARDADIVFLNNKGRGLTRVMIFHIIKKAALAAGITKTISPHTFRHSFATHLLEGGASIRQVQEMLGHESILTTEIYTHLDSGKLRENVDLPHPLADL